MEAEPTINLESTPPARRTELTVHEIDGEALIYDPRTADTHRLNNTALFIWRCCDGRNTPAEIAERIFKNYDVTPDDAIAQTRRILAEFDQKGLLAVVELKPSVEDEMNAHASCR